MNRTANIDGTKYRLLEVLPQLGSEAAMILCEDDSGRRAVCPEALWRSCAPIAESHAPVSAQSTSQEKIDFFLSLFRGRDDVHARRYHSVKTGKSGYTPVCQNEWEQGLCDKKKHKCPECPHRKFVPLTAESVRAHLIGRDSLCRDVAAIYPILGDNSTRLLVVDFDEEHWQLDVTAFCDTCRELGLAPAVERSRSGNGAHVWFFFTEAVSAADARRLGTALLTQTMAHRHELSFSSYDRLFPSQDTVPKGGFGNLIALPFQGQAQKNGNTLFVDETFTPYPDQWAFLSTLPKITPNELEQHLQRLCPHGEMGDLLDAKEPQAPWLRRKSRRKLRQEDFPLQAVVHQSNLIYLDKSGFSQRALDAIKRLAAFPNPEFRAKQAMHLSVYGVPRVLDCGYEDDRYIGLPRGCAEPLFALFEQHDVPVICDDHRCPGRSIDIEFTGKLRDEQAPAAEALLANETGVLSATTAFGKTVIGAYLIGQRKVNTLILVQSSALLDQWKASLEQFLQINETLPELPKKRGRKKQRFLIGQVGSGKNTRSGIIDIAIMQSLFEGEEKTVKEFVAEYGMVLVDECHHVAAFTFESVLKAAEARFVYGLSATPVRKDGHHSIIFMQCGPVRYLVDAKSQAKKHAFSHFVIPRFTRLRLPAAGSIQDLYAGVIQNLNRNELLLADAVALVKEGRTPILLTERKEHAALLAERLSGKIKNVFLLIGSDKQKDKREKIAALQSVPDDEEVIVVATGKYIGEGFDAPRLDTLLLAMPISWKGTLAQYAGRLHRNYTNKQEVRIYDYVDLHVPMLERMYHKRLRGYAELGYQVKFGSADQSVSQIFDGHTAMEAFEKDLADAARGVVIVSPYLQKTRVAKLLPLLQRGAVVIHTRAPECYAAEQQAGIQNVIETLMKSGVTVRTRRDLQQRYAVIDESIVWYGSVDFLAFGRKDTAALRFENADIAGELLALSGEAGERQLAIDEILIS